MALCPSCLQDRSQQSGLICWECAYVRPPSPDPMDRVPESDDLTFYFWSGIGAIEEPSVHTLDSALSILETLGDMKLSDWTLWVRRGAGRPILLAAVVAGEFIPLSSIDRLKIAVGDFPGEAEQVTIPGGE